MCVCVCVCVCSSQNAQLGFHFSTLLTLRTIWYELQAGVWPISDQPVEAKIWLLGSGEGIRKVPAEANLGKEITVSPEPGSDP